MKNLLTVLFLVVVQSICLAQTPPNFIPRVNATGTSAGTNTHLINPSILGGNMTNSGALTWRLGAGSAGSTLSIVDTNGLFRFLIRNDIIAFRDTNVIRFRIDTNSMSMIDPNSIVRVFIGEDRFTVTDSAGFDRLLFFQDGMNAGDTVVNDALGSSRITLEQDGAGAGESIFRDALSVERIRIEQDGMGVGATIFNDAAGNVRFYFDTDGNGIGFSTVYDSGGTDRFTASVTDMDSSGDSIINDPVGNSRFMAEYNGADSSGDTLIKDSIGVERFAATQDGSGAGIDQLNDADGTQRIRIEQDGMGVGATIFNDATGAFQMAVNSTGIHGNGFGLTNVLEKNVSVTTNGWGNSVLNFSLGTQIDTNLTSNLTLSGIDGFVTSNLNWQVVGLLTDGSIRTVTVPASFHTVGFTAKAAAIPANSFAKLTVEALIGRRTNATIEIFTP